MPTLRDILDALARPGRDPREDLPPPIFKKGILKLEDLQPGMELKGTVLNVVDFGAFVDIGLKDSGLVHISQLANRYIKSPYDVVAVGDVVTVWVLKVDQERHRVSLTMIKPGTERKPPERREQPRRGGHEQQQQGQGQQQGKGQGQRDQDRRPPRRGQRPQQGRPAAAAVQSGAQAGQALRGSRIKGRRTKQPPARSSAGRRRAASSNSSNDGPISHRAASRSSPRSPGVLEGSAPLRTFAELKAFLDAKKEE